MGRFSRSWELIKESFAVLRSDKQLALLPFASGVSCLLVSGLVLLGGGLIFFFLGGRYTPAVESSWRADPSMMWALIWIAVFAFYLVNYFIIVFFNVALISAASERLAGRPATLRGGVAKAWEHKGKILQWAVLAATVGVILRMIERRLGIIGRLVTKLIGVAWTLASYFVAPILVFENLGPLGALKRSARIFRETWGEELVSQFSMSAIFVLLGLAGFGVWFAMMLAGGAMGLYIGTALLFLYMITLGVTNAAIQGVFTAALYRFATTKEIPPGFVPENFSMAWGPKDKNLR